VSGYLTWWRPLGYLDQPIAGCSSDAMRDDLMKVPIGPAGGAGH